MKCPQCEFDNRPQAKFCEACSSTSSERRRSHDLTHLACRRKSKLIHLKHDQ